MGERDNKVLERQKIEEKYHNKKYKILKTRRPSPKKENSAYVFYRKLRGDISKLNILDFGCGNGWVSIDLAKSGAQVWGIDISEESIKKARKWAENENLSNKIKFEKMPGENIKYNDNFFDLVLGSAILHHTEIKLAVKEIFRVLKPGGKALFIEPMNQNVFLKIWRKLTPWRRSPMEKALTYKDIMFIRDIFPKINSYFFGFLSIFTSGLIIIFRSNPFLVYVHVCAEKIDDMLLKAIPFLGKYCSVVVLELSK